MGHVEECSSCVPLHAHVFGFCQPCQGLQSSGPSYLRLVVLVRCEVCYAAYCVALNFDIGGIHLFDQRRKPAQCDNGNFVFRCGCQCYVPAPCRMYILFTARLPNAALAARCTSISGFWRRNNMGSRVSLSTSLTSGKGLLEHFTA
jgi:hypothetical protein